MLIIKDKTPLSTFMGYSLTLGYITFTIISILFYPSGINPLEDYLSYLGDYSKNPIGAYFYNIGCIITGVLLMGFFIGFRLWYSENRIQKKLVIIAQIIGFLDSITLILVGVFENGNELHGTISSIFFVTNLGFLISTGIALMPHKDYNKYIGIFGFIVGALDLTYLSTSGVPLVEWLTVFTALIYAVLISINMNKKFGS